MKAKNFFLTLLIVILVLGLLAAGLWGYKKFIYKDQRHLGTWERDIDITKEVTDAMNTFINPAILGDETDYGEARVTVKSRLTLDESGCYTETLANGTYDAAYDAAVKVASTGLMNFLKNRAAWSGLSIDLSEDELLACFTEAAGMGLPEYIEAFCPALLPDESTLRERYTDSGNYKAGDGILSRGSYFGLFAEHYMIDKEHLVLLDAGAVADPEVSVLTYLGEGEPQKAPVRPQYPVLYQKVSDAEGSTVGAGISLLPSLSFWPALTCYADEYDQSEYQVNMSVRLLGGEETTIRSIHVTYDGNIYVSLRDLASLLSETKACYDLSVSATSTRITKGAQHTQLPEEAPFTQPVRDIDAPEYISTKNNSFYVDDIKHRFYTILYPLSEEVYDCYMYLPDFVELFDLGATYEEGILVIDPSSHFFADPRQIEEAHGFDCINSVLLGDATTGEVYYSYHAGDAYAIGSTSKLMSYAVFMDALSLKKVSLSDKVRISENAHKLSYSSDSLIHMEAGARATLEDLLYGMLLPSSNECALALAEHVAGSEAEFVKCMNKKAEQLHMTSTVYYNPHGLPAFTDEVFIGKIQNLSSAEDLFRLSSYLLKTYPQLTDITSTKQRKLSSLGVAMSNTNMLLWNLPDCIGLKTGSTNKAGNCLVSAIEVKCKDGIHDIVCIELGAENQIVRNSMSTTLLSYGREIALSGGVEAIPEYTGTPLPDTDSVNKNEIPDNAEDLAARFMWVVQNHLGKTG